MKIKFTKKVSLTNQKEEFTTQLKSIVNQAFNENKFAAKYKEIAEERLSTDNDFRQSILNHFSNGIEYKSLEFLKLEINSKERHLNENYPIYDYSIEALLHSIDYECLSINPDKTVIYYKEDDMEIKFVKTDNKDISVYLK